MKIGLGIYPAISYKKSVTTANYEKDAGKPQEVTALMVHSWETANKVYHIREQMNTAAKATAVIKDHFNKNKTTVETTETSPNQVKKVRSGKV